jgi:PAS domain S-box-containing protein
VVLLVGLATVATAGVRPVIETYTVNVYVVAIALAAWYGGLGPGLLATAVSALALDYFFAPPYFSLFPISTSDAVRLALLVLAGLTISWVCHLLRRAVRDVAAGVDRLAARETLFRHTFEQAAVGIAHVGLDGRWLRLNARLAEIVGYAPDELRARTFQDITHPDDLGADLSQVQALLRGESERYAMDKRYVRRDGSRVWVRLTVSLVRDAVGAPDYFISVVEDIDPRRRAEAEAGRLGAMLAHISDAVVAFDGEDLRIRFVNAEAERLWRRPAAEMLGRTLLDLFPDTAELPFFGETRRAVVGQQPVRYEEFYPAHDAWYEVRVYPTAGPDGPGALAIFQDVTARRIAVAQAEEARLLAEAGSQAKSDFLAAMSHEIRTPINAIGGYVELLELGIAGPLTAEQRSYLARARAAAQGLLTIVNDVLDLAKVEAGMTTVARRVAWPGTAAEAAVTLVQPQALAKGIALVNACAGDGAYWGDEPRVQQILTNLVGNAVKFTAPGGRVTVTCGRTDAGPGTTGVAIPPAGAEGASSPRVRPRGPWSGCRTPGSESPRRRSSASSAPSSRRTPASRAATAARGSG